MFSQNYFNKKFAFQTSDRRLPSEDVFFSSNNSQKHEGLQVIKSILNHVKSKLNDVIIEEWSRHTRHRNPAQQILHHLKTDVRAEFVTQAFAKFFECVSAYRMVGNEFLDVFQSVHLCEAPGAFICSLNHYLKLHHPDVEFRWRASTLNPYFEGNSISNTILDDRLISHTLENWIFGEDYDGDILKENNIRSLIAYCKPLNVNLVTADGSIDCLDQPENQEESVSKLHMAEFIVSLAILADKGSILIKMFTFYELSSISMLYILNCCFQELHIFKPATSKEGNSEVYVIGIGYKKHCVTDELIERMIINFKDDSKPMLPLKAIPKEFQEEVVEAARFFMNKQVAVIECNIRTFKKYDKMENERIKLMKLQIVEDYARLYNLAPIRDDQKLLHGLRVNSNINLNSRVHSGSHSERLIFFHLNRCDRIQVLFDRLKQFYDSIFENAMNSSCVALKLQKPDIDPVRFLNLIKGKPIEQVVSSKFILVSLVKYLIELRTFLEDEPEGREIQSFQRFTIVGNHFNINMEFFRRASSYDAYEKDVAKNLLEFVQEQESEALIIEGLPLFTQFLVGLIFFLSLYVFDEVHLKRSSGTISLKQIKADGKKNLKVLSEILENRRNTSNAIAILGICDTKLLFSFSQDFYKSVIDYNNHICLKLSSFYLNLGNNLI